MMFWTNRKVVVAWYFPVPLSSCSQFSPQFSGLICVFVCLLSFSASYICDFYVFVICSIVVDLIVLYEICLSLWDIFHLYKYNISSFIIKYFKLNSFMIINTKNIKDTKQQRRKKNIHYWLNTNDNWIQVWKQENTQ